MKFITILACKILSFVGRLVGKGSSLPGAIALKLCPNILSRLTLPKDIVAVTGSNGKTSTVEMVARVLQKAGKRVVYNKEGSNQIEGVTTMLLNHATLGGKVKGDLVLLESDERFARLTFRHIKPTLFAVTNLYRDQLTRNGHPYRIYDAIYDAVKEIPDATLLLNADDPLVSNLASAGNKSIYFGMSKNDDSTSESDAVFQDAYYCPRCKGKMEYDYFHYTHLGSYRCTSCGYSRNEPVFLVDSLNLAESKATINGNEMVLGFADRYNVYNLCTAYGICELLNIDRNVTVETLNDFVMRTGRVVRFQAGENPGLLITSKHENSTSYNQSLQYVRTRPEECDLIVLVDAISRKYYTAETSWLWDISFEMLEGSKVQNIYLTGKYAYDLGVRFEEAGITTAKIIVEPDLDRMAEAIKAKTGRMIYAVTCFSDKEKLYERVTLDPDSVK